VERDIRDIVKKNTEFMLTECDNSERLSIEGIKVDKGGRYSLKCFFGAGNLKSVDYICEANDRWFLVEFSNLVKQKERMENCFRMLKKVLPESGLDRQNVGRDCERLFNKIGLKVFVDCVKDSKNCVYLIIKEIEEKLLASLIVLFKYCYAKNKKLPENIYAIVGICITSKKGEEVRMFEHLRGELKKRLEMSGRLSPLFKDITVTYATDVEKEIGKLRR